jgi:tetratricopeptide (TPR) repeat protein
LNERSVAVHSLATVVGASAFILDTSDFLLDTLDFCLAEARPIGDTNLEIHIRNIRGVLLLKRGAFDASLAEFQAVCALLPEGDGTFPEPVVLANMAAVRMRKAEAAQRGERPALQLEAEQAINAVLTVAGKAGNREALSRAHYSRAGLLVQREDFALALNAFNESLMLAEGLKHRYRLIGIQIECGHIHLAMENYSLALAAFEGAHLEADTCRPCQELQIASDGMAAAHDKLGNRRAMLFANGLARREADEYRLACDTARRELGEFWREIGAS